MDDPCLTCGHERDIHQGANATEWCRRPGCICTKFERTQEGGDAHEPDALFQHGGERSSAIGADVTGPATASTPTGAVAGPPDRHQFRPVLGELEDLCHCATCGLPRDHATHDQAVAGPPDLAHAIQAAKVALEATYDWDGYDIGEIARIAVDAATAVPIQPDDLKLAVHALTAQLDLEAQLQATRDRLADLEVYAAELHDLLARTTQLQTADRHGECSFCGMAPDHAHCWWCGSRQAEAANPQHTADCLFAAAIQADPPTRGRTILEEVGRLRAELASYRDPYREKAALDLDAAQEEDSG